MPHYHPVRSDGLGDGFGKLRVNWETLLQHIGNTTATTVRGRYAPSPSGPLHLGNIRTGLLAWLHARLYEGVFVLRMEDLDRPRMRPGCAASILGDLRWLGLDWDEGPDIGGSSAPYTQSERDAYYHSALDYLQRKQLLFACTCSRKDLALAASAPHENDTPGVYPGTCRALAPGAATPGRPTALRFRAPDCDIAFDDAIFGPQRQHLAREVGDFVVRRADQLMAYQLAVVVDDALMGITDVVRGADLLDSTPRQIALFHALDAPYLPRFWHVPLMRDAAGQRLAKRTAAESLGAWRERGATPAQIVGMLAAGLGFTPERTELSARELLRALTPETFRATLVRTTMS